MTAPKPVDPNSIDIDDELVVAEEFEPFGGEEATYDADAAAQGESQEEAERRRAIEEAEEHLPYMGDPDADHAPKIEVDDRPASVRTAELFREMKPRRRELLGILRLCAEPTPVEEVYASVDRAQAAHRSVYSGESLCGLLVRAGALERVEPEKQEPETEVVDGVECYTPAEPVPVMYRTLPAGTEAVEADKPAERIRAALDKEPEYKPIYLRILLACAEGDGKTAKELGELVDQDPLLQKPRRWAAYFFGILGEADALAWDKTWKTTDYGLDAIAELEAEGVTE